MVAISAFCNLNFHAVQVPYSGRQRQLCVLIMRFAAEIWTRWRPYRVEYTGSLLTSEVKRHRARLVLGWGTAWEDLRVLSAFLTFMPMLLILFDINFINIHLRFVGLSHFRRLHGPCAFVWNVKRLRRQCRAFCLSRRTFIKYGCPHLTHVRKFML